jgi:hypothetical protein
MHTYSASHVLSWTLEPGLVVSASGLLRERMEPEVRPADCKLVAMPWLRASGCEAKEASTYA